MASPGRENVPLAPFLSKANAYSLPYAPSAPLFCHLEQNVVGAAVYRTEMCSKETDILVKIRHLVLLDQNVIDTIVGKKIARSL